MKTVCVVPCCFNVECVCVDSNLVSPGSLPAPPPTPPPPSAEKKWFTDEPENAYPRNIQIKPMSTHMANQVNQYKSTSSLIPPIREVEDECWVPGPLSAGGGGVGHPFFVGAERQTWWQGVVWRCFCLPPQFYMSEENWKGPPMCIPLTLLPCFLVNDLIYKCIHRDVYNWQSSKDCTAP